MSFVEEYGNMTVGEALELAHQDYEKRKRLVLSKLETIKYDVSTHNLYKQWLDDIAEFIMEREV